MEFYCLKTGKLTSRPNKSKLVIHKLGLHNCSQTRKIANSIWAPPKQCFENISSWVYFLSFTACQQLNIMRYDIVHKIDFKVVTGKKFAKTVTVDLYWYNYSHKKQKDSLETQAELSVVSTYVENQAILEPILLYRGSKCKQTKEQGSEGCLWTHIVTFL